MAPDPHRSGGGKYRLETITKACLWSHIAAGRRSRLGRMPQTASPELVERFTAGFECWNGGELDLMQDMYAEDAEFDISTVFIDTPPYRGHESMRRYWRETWDAWEGIRMDPVEVFELGGGRFVVDVRFWGKGKRSGVEVDQRFAYLYTLRDVDEKIVRCQLFSTVQAAIQSATASQEAAHAD
jgi:ketosteroid isomerase-like protein